MTSQALRCRDATATHGDVADHAAPVLLLAPSRGLRGGIERYVQTVQSAFDDQGVAHLRLDLPRPGPAGHRALLTEAAALLTGPGRPARVIVAHRALLPVAALLARIRPVSGISVICHGIDVWGVRAGLEVMTALRLGAWRDKGLPQLTAAIGALRRTDVRLTVCGSGEPPADLLTHISALPWCTLRPGLADHDLAAQFAASDLFVLASRTRSGRRPCGEGFGLVLLEAQIAGTAVVGPAHGGSPDAYLDGITGTTPRDESAAALAEVLGELLRRPAELVEMGARGAQWARARFAPDRYAALAVDRLL